MVPADAAVAAALRRARAAAGHWGGLPLTRRLQVIRRARRMIAAQATDLAARIGRDAVAESLVAEVLPLCEAARFLERDAGRLLAPRRLGRAGRPAWLVGVSAEVRREPYGVVLVLAPANYPLFLPGVQVLQALAAGNVVVAKPAAGCAPPLVALAGLLRRAGLPEDALVILPDDIATGQAASRAGFDRIVLTGAAATGVQVLTAAAASLTPCIMELSGDDPVLVLPGADLALAASAIAYGVRLNGGNTCIAPRRVLAWTAAAEPLRQALHAVIPAADRLPEIIPVRDAEEAIAVAASSPYALGAAIFGPQAAAQALAARLPAGCVVINDVIVPTADPRLPFGGRRRSGFGVTRGAEGLLDLTRVKTVSIRRGRFRPHLRPARDSDVRLFAHLIRALHGTWPERGKAALALLRPPG